MSTATASPVLQHFRRLVGGKVVATMSDDELLHQFLQRNDEGAFTALVQRHGPVVLGVCQRVLANRHDAEDAFQATFLVLVRKGHAVVRRQSVGSWLYGVAYRTAQKARVMAARRRRREKEAAIMPDAHGENEAAWSDVRPVIDEELNRLPEKYRSPLILCYLESKTNDQAARQLGWTKGTVSGRLARARDLLRTRLARRGVALSSVGLAGTLTQNATAAVSPLLTTQTVANATWIAAGKAAAAGAISSSVAALTEGVLKSMVIAKIKWTALVAAFGLLVAGGGGAVFFASPADAGVSPQLGAAGKLVATNAKADDDMKKIQGSWAIVEAEREGLKAPDNEREQMMFLRFTFTGEKITIGAGDEGKSGTFKLDASKKPKIITVSGFDEKKESATGIYSLEGETLKLCIQNRPNGEGPKEFATTKGDGFILFVLKRAGADDKPNPEAAQKLKEAANRMVSQNNLKQIGLAMHNYAATYNRFPAAAIHSKDGKPLLSWRVAILPYVEEDALYRQFKLDEPWDSENNKKLIAKMPKIYAPPGMKTKEPFTTMYCVFTGPGSIFEKKEGARFADITDGTSNTMLAVEAGDAVVWTKPEDLKFDASKPLPKLGGMFQSGFNILMADGSVRFCPKEFNETTLKAIITRNGNEIIDMDDLKKKK